MAARGTKKIPKSLVVSKGLRRQFLGVTERQECCPPFLRIPHKIKMIMGMKSVSKEIQNDVGANLRWHGR